MTTSEQQAVPVAQERESALATAFCLLDTFAGEGLGHTYGNGQQIDADTTVFALCTAFDMEPEDGWYRNLATELAALPLPCKSGEGAGEYLLGDVDWGLPIEAVRYDGRVVPATAHATRDDRMQWVTWRDDAGDINAGYIDYYTGKGADHPDWHIRNVAAVITPDATQTREAEALAKSLDALKWANERLHHLGTLNDYSLGMVRTLAESEAREVAARAALNARGGA